MVSYLELLAPARNKDIGIAAIDCGADAVYIAGPSFGARQAAGNSLEDIRELCGYAHRFGARIFLTLNTILYDDELDEAYRLMCGAEDAGADALIVQDLAVLKMVGGGPDGTGRKIRIPLHASTQCAIRDPEKAVFYRNLGFSRLVLERELPLSGIREISGAAGCEMEFFVHGALCVCYSGQCYLSENIAGRSANRGECIQACRSLYDLTDSSGRTLVKNRALLSLKDYNLLHRLSDLAETGVNSFKIEGRLKNISYVRNVVRAYSEALDDLVSRYPEKYARASFGKVSGGFTPATEKTFNRGYTELYLDGQRGRWASMDTPKGMGEPVGKVVSVRPAGRDGSEIVLELGKGIALDNGDGFAFTGKDSEITGFRGDVCSGNTVRCRRVTGLQAGMTLYRNISAAFEKTVSSCPCTRMIGADVNVHISGDSVSGYTITADAATEDGRKVSVNADAGKEPAGNRDRMMSVICSQFGKCTGHYRFLIPDTGGGISINTGDGNIPFVSAAFLNSLRRSLAGELENIPVNARKSLVPQNLMRTARPAADCREESPSGKNRNFPPAELDYKFNISNRLSRQVYLENGASAIEPAYELSRAAGAELMRTKYCIRYELGLCPKHHRCKTGGPLYLKNNGRTFALEFDCAHCEMTVKETQR